MSELWFQLPLAFRAFFVILFALMAVGVAIVAIDLVYLFKEGQTDVDPFPVSRGSSPVDAEIRAREVVAAVPGLRQKEPWLATGARRDAVIGRDQADRERRLRLIAMQGGRR